MDSPTRHAVPGHLSKPRKLQSRQVVTLLGRRMANPPPRFLQASKLPDLAPRRAPEVRAQLTQAEQYLACIPAPPHMMFPLASASGASNYSHKASPALYPQAENPHLNWTTPPAAKEHNFPALGVVNLLPPDPGHILAPPSLGPYQAPGPVTRLPGALLHPTPRQSIHLPEATDRFPFQSPTHRLPQVSYKQSPSPFDQADFSFDLEAVLRKNSQFLSAQTTGVTTYTAADILASMPRSSPAYINTSDRLVDPGDGHATVSADTLPRIEELRTYVALMGERFGCCINYDFVRKLINPEVLEYPLFSFDERKSEAYKRHVRCWAATATGATIFEKLLVAFEPGSYVNNERFTVPYFWFVFLIRELLINNCYAKDSGSLLRLGACCMDPCDSSFRFFSLETAMRQLLGQMNSKSRFYARDTTVQQRVLGKCCNNHFHITMSDQSFFNLYTSISKPKFDTIEYQNELRAWFVKLVNRVDPCSGFTAFVLITFMILENE